MTIEVRIPQLSMSMTDGVISEWLVENGTAVEEGTPLYSLENDKATQEIEAPASGTVRIIGIVGETYPVGEVVASID